MDEPWSSYDGSVSRCLCEVTRLWESREDMEGCFEHSLERWHLSGRLDSTTML
jgi:hypothetical protein